MTPVTRRRLLLLAPLAVVGGAGGAAAALLMRMREGRYDPHALPSMLLGKKLPVFALPGQPPSAGFSTAEVTAGGRPAVVNFFASWCVPCAEEAPTLTELKRTGVALWGIAYKDAPDATARFLAQYGDPYERIGRDAAGTVGIDFGLYGVPESYLVDAGGIVRWRWAGGLSADIVRQDLLPRMRALS
jgi:cytochrome c biogenesis protein CcmG, thiol:disulfide interchange protein DsbE